LLQRLKSFRKEVNMKRKKVANAVPVLNIDPVDLGGVLAYVRKFAEELPAHETFEPDPKIVKRVVRLAQTLERKKAGAPSQGYVSAALQAWRELEGTRFPWQKGLTPENLLLWGKYLGNAYATFLALRAGVGRVGTEGA
jgi:hypothetical protein